MQAVKPYSKRFPMRKAADLQNPFRILFFIFSHSFIGFIEFDEFGVSFQFIQTFY